jgi:recombination protein RecR
MKALDEVVELLTRLPGIGRKSALRVAYYILKSDGSYALALSERILALKHSIGFCSICGSYTETEPCPVCSSTTRERGLICVVEQPQDVVTIEASREFHGLYHVLGGLISPLDGVGPENLRVAELIERLKGGEVSEVVVATNPTVEGDTTALYLKRALEACGVEVSRLATGIPVGGDLEYADRLTLARSFRGRVRL